MMTVLIVDDSLIMREKISSIMKNLGYKTILAENGKEAIRAYNDNSPDFVTMDIVMPEMDGITALKYILKIDPEAKVIMTTSYKSESMIMDSIKAGALSYIVKPFTEEKIIDNISKIFGKDNYL